MHNLAFLRRHAAAILLAVLFLPIAWYTATKCGEEEGRLVPVEARVLRSESVSRGRWTSLQSNPRKTHHATVTYDLASRGQYSEVVTEEFMPKDAVILVWADPVEFNRAYGTRSVPCATGAWLLPLLPALFILWRERLLFTKRRAHGEAGA